MNKRAVQSDIETVLVKNVLTLNVFVQFPPVLPSMSSLKYRRTSRQTASLRSDVTYVRVWGGQTMVYIRTIHLFVCL